jgi:hypothetical protein
MRDLADLARIEAKTFHALSRDGSRIAETFFVASRTIQSLYSRSREKHEIGISQKDGTLGRNSRVDVQGV